MVAKRLVIIMVVLLVISTVAAALVDPASRNGSDNNNSSGETTASGASGASSSAGSSSSAGDGSANSLSEGAADPEGAAPVPGRFVRRRITLEPGKLPTVTIRVGDQLQLEVLTPEPEQVEIPDLELIGASDDFAPARFELTARAPGEIAVSLFGEKKHSAIVRVAPAKGPVARAPEQPPRRKAKGAKRPARGGSARKSEPSSDGQL